MPQNVNPSLIKVAIYYEEVSKFIYYYSVKDKTEVSNRKQKLHDYSETSIDYTMLKKSSQSKIYTYFHSVYHRLRLNKNDEIRKKKIIKRDGKLSKL